MLVSVNARHPEPRKIAQAVEVLERGGTIAYPTDTVYGIGCDLSNKRAVERVYQLRQLPRDKSLAIICPDLSDIARYAHIDNDVYRLLKRFLPGPYCFILPASREVPKMMLTRQKTIGIRVPDHPVPIALAAGLGRPLISTTAALPGQDLFIDPREINDEMRGLDMVLDGGAGGSLSSTVVDLSSGEVQIVREGAGPIDAFT